MSKPSTSPSNPALRPDGRRLKLSTANRAQIEMQVVDLENLVADDHVVRIVWAYVLGLDLTVLYDAIQTFEGETGGPAIDPRILMALWLFATLEGVGSGRELSRLCTRDIPYRWICGGVTPNHHTLSDFRVAHGRVLDKLLTDGVAGLMHEGLVELNRVAQDGMRVRASAGAASFRRTPTLDECVRDAEAQVENLKKEIDKDPKAVTAQMQAARERAANDRLERVKRALATAKEIQASKPAKEQEKVRVSTTDSDARVMKMADGGFRPAYNVQFGTDTGAQVIVGVDVTNSGSDQGEAPPMVEQLQERYERVPEEMLVDGGFANHDDIDGLEKKGVKVYAPVRQPNDKTKDPHAPRKSDGPGVRTWRERMRGDAAKTIYKERAATAECVNALARNRGLRQFGVRGIDKIFAATMWYALAHNLMRAFKLRQAQMA
jgi:transposase